MMFKEWHVIEILSMALSLCLGVLTGFYATLAFFVEWNPVALLLGVQGIVSVITIVAFLRHGEDKE